MRKLFGFDNALKMSQFPLLVMFLAAFTYLGFAVSGEVLNQKIRFFRRMCQRGVCLSGKRGRICWKLWIAQSQHWPQLWKSFM